MSPLLSTGVEGVRTGLHLIWRAAVCAAVAGGLGSLPATAQTVTPEPSAALTCLTRAPGAELGPEYPFKAWKEQRAGRVKVELVFTTADTRPEVIVQVAQGETSADGETRSLVVDAVKDQARGYRVPCLDAQAGPARVVIDFVFKPDSQRASWEPPSDADDERTSD